MAKFDFDTTLKRLHALYARAVKESDAKYAREVKKAADYLENKYNKIWPDDPSNAEVVGTYKKLMEIAERHAAERDGPAVKKHNRMTEKILAASDTIKAAGKFMEHPAGGLARENKHAHNK
ncbi:MAG: hypothetical protein LBJ73_04340 [Rickettsiales bacterium]|nr:hypothetical protein [Rickettsiales bacterium]